MSYKIVRFYAAGVENRVIDTGLSLEEAKAHCKDPESSSRTCTSADGVRETDQYGDWFDGFTEDE